jgi:hypothetical protein
MRLSVSVKDDEVEILADVEGLEFLQSKIALLLSRPPADHVHFNTKAWGRGELTEEPPQDGWSVANHLVIQTVP